MPTYEAVFPGPGTTADIRLRLDITENSQSVGTNQSVVGYSAYLYKNGATGSPFNTSAQSDVVCVVNGSTVINTGNQNYNFRSPNNFNGATVALGSGTIPVTHAADGTKTVSFSLSFVDLPSKVIGDASLSSSLALTRIQRPVWIKVAGVWTLAIAWVKVAGVWVHALPWVKVSGVWKNPKF